MGNAASVAPGDGDLDKKVDVKVSKKEGGGDGVAKKKKKKHPDDKDAPVDPTDAGPVAGNGSRAGSHDVNATAGDAPRSSPS